MKTVAPAKRRAVPLLEPILCANEPFDMITHAAARSWARIVRADPSDTRPATDLLATGGHSVMIGAASALAYDGILPQESAVTELIAILDAKEEAALAVRGSGDPRDTCCR